MSFKCGMAKDMCLRLNNSVLVKYNSDAVNYKTTETSSAESSFSGWFSRGLFLSHLANDRALVKLSLRIFGQLYRYSALLPHIAACFVFIEYNFNCGNVSEKLNGMNACIRNFTRVCQNYSKTQIALGIWIATEYSTYIQSKRNQDNKTVKVVNQIKMLFTSSVNNTEYAGFVGRLRLNDKVSILGMTYNICEYFYRG
ncbi:hypothetical protein BD770DRAFT_407601 [Pilaira anomala]|nr:hypothetical protein BD770DRAFT_407601 [Pilaira anomala]